MELINTYLQLKGLLLQLVEGMPEIQIQFGATVRADRLPEAIRPKDRQFVRIAARITTEEPDDVKYLLCLAGFEEITSSLFHYGGHLVSVQRPFEQQPSPEAPAPPQPQQPQPQKKSKSAGYPS
jgi:hypothetical protein